MGRNARIASRLLAWYDRGHRELPWRGTRDPYRIWVSEIMLQQTRARAAIPFYLRFIERFPTLRALAAADEAEVLAAWSGLGYYSRARNLHRAARQVAAAGRFPRDYDGLRALPGVGPYTAAAIASIAFGRPHAVLDGNVLRVISRVCNDASDIGSSTTRERFGDIAQSWLDAHRPGAFNQALMELGATLCLPRTPLCPGCPLGACCQARRQGSAAQLPVKLRNIAAERVKAEFALVTRNGRVLLWRREDHAARMAGFWELPAPERLPDFRRRAVVAEFRHTITRHLYLYTVLAGTVRRAPPGMRWFSLPEIAEIPITTASRKALLVSAM